MESSKGNNTTKRPALKTISSNNILSNVHCQDESSSMSPLLCQSGLRNQCSVDWCDFDVTETLPSDWLSDYPKSYKSTKISTKVNAQVLDKLKFSKSFLLNDNDDSSRGSDSGLGSETIRSKARLDAFYDLNESLEMLSSPAKPFSSNSFDQSMDMDDGFVDDKENEFLMRSNTTSLDFSSPFRHHDSIIFRRKCFSPFNLHRRSTASICDSRPKMTKPSPADRTEKNCKRLLSNDSSANDEKDHAVSTTPKRRKSLVGNTKRASSALFQSADLHSTQSCDVIINTEMFPANQNSSIKANSGRYVLARSHSEIPSIPTGRMDEKKVDRVIEAIDSYSLMGYSNTSHILPTTDRQRFELTSVDADDVVKVLLNDAANSKDFLLIDCRYPYEYNGGHVKNAINIHTQEQVLEKLFYPAFNRMKTEEEICFRPKDKTIPSSNVSALDGSIDSLSIHSPLQCMKNHVNQSCTLVFYCEFSSRRAPNLAKYLRSIDRKSNLCKYPYLFYPEIYIMSGGYHNFVQKYLNFCEPEGYVKMFDKRFATELGNYKRKTRKLRPDKQLSKRSPISPLRLEQEDNRIHSSPPGAIVWS